MSRQITKVTNKNDGSYVLYHNECWSHWIGRPQNGETFPYEAFEIIKVDAKVTGNNCFKCECPC